MERWFKTVKERDEYISNIDEDVTVRRIFDPDKEDKFGVNIEDSTNTTPFGDDKCNGQHVYEEVKLKDEIGDNGETINVIQYRCIMCGNISGQVHQESKVENAQYMVLALETEWSATLTYCAGPYTNINKAKEAAEMIASVLYHQWEWVTTSDNIPYIQCNDVIETYRHIYIIKSPVDVMPTPDLSNVAYLFKCDEETDGLL